MLFTASLRPRTFMFRLPDRVANVVSDLRLIAVGLELRDQPLNVLGRLDELLDLLGALRLLGTQFLGHGSLSAAVPAPRSTRARRAARRRRFGGARPGSGRCPRSRPGSRTRRAAHRAPTG